MKKIVVWLCMMIFLASLQTTIQAEEPREKLLEDALLIQLLPVISEALKKQYGEFKQYDSDKIIEIKRLHPETCEFKLKIQLITFEGDHDPPNDLITMELDNTGENGFQVTKINVKRLPFRKTGLSGCTIIKACLVG
jgi:hypothetical protein